MADTIERLATCARQLLDAAAEIERLRGMHQDMGRVAGNLGDENERLRAALKICAAEWSTPPTTVGEVAGHVGREFVRRMSIAAAALGDEQTSGQDAADNPARR